MSGLRWRGDLLALRAVEENIQKARRAFFHFGSIGAFQSLVNKVGSGDVWFQFFCMVVKIGL